MNETVMKNSEEVVNTVANEIVEVASKQKRSGRFTWGQSRKTTLLQIGAGTIVGMLANELVIHPIGERIKAKKKAKIENEIETSIEESLNDDFDDETNSFEENETK